MEIRRATEADTEVMRRLWDEFTVEATFAPSPGNPFEPALLTDHMALVAEENGDELQIGKFKLVFFAGSRPGGGG